MKKQLLLFFALIYWGATCIAQVNKQQHEHALSLVRASSKAIGISEKDLDNLVVSSAYQTSDGIMMVYLQQTFKGIPLFNQMQVLAFRNGKLVSQAGLPIPQIGQFVNNKAAVPMITAAEAVKAALRDRKMPVPASIIAIEQNESKASFGNLGIALSDITAELVWLPVSNKDVRLTWQIDLAPQSTPDHWMIRVDAANAAVLDKNNLTVYEQFPTAESEPSPLTTTHNSGSSKGAILFSESPFVVNTASYRVVPYPAESPNHTGGAPAIVTDPWNSAPGNATSLKWNFDGTTYHDSTRGNNVWAQEDRDNSNTTFGKAAVSTTAQPALSFNFVPNFTLAPTTTVNQQFATTNLFYWNNIVHDLTYLYGFNEVSGNFQANNQGRGGSGNDYVIADAQDAGGTNNANFSTPTDGSRPRMQMYLFTGITPNRDGDLDNGIIVHEYGHGISNRLTGGPANSSCLGNAEQGGEGWSDYFALMATTNWSTAQVTDGALAKPMGTYVLGQATTGAGIRQYPYSTNMSINPWTYALLAGTGGEVHTTGEIWCTALWEMTWQMIAQDGINPNLFNPAATGGNSAAMKLVIEGLRLQPCSPGYIDARNAILKADTLFFGARYSCAIWTAFAKRGMGKGASQGSSNSTTDQVASFVANGASLLLLTQNVSSQQEGLNIVYTNHVNAGSCGALSNYLLTDTLPANVTYVSGGTYNAGNRVVSFPVNLAQGASQDYTFTVQINPGSYFPPATLINETVAGATIPSTWTATNTTGSSVWTVSTAQSRSPTRSFFATDNASAITDFRLATNTAIALGSIPPAFTFWHYYNTEAGWDGGVVEISTNGGTTWTDLGANITTNGYNGSVGGTNPIAGRSAFTGNSGGFIQTKISLLPYANQTALFRFRATSDDNTAATGWYIDDILMSSLAVVNMRSSLFNNTGLRVSYTDTVTTILPSSCVSGTITSNPSNVNVCTNANANFNVSATGTSLTYQWQVSTDGGINFTNIPTEVNATLSLTAVTVSMNNYRYRCQVSGTCTSVISSASGTLTVNALPAEPSPINGASCGQGTVNISANPASGETIDWYAIASGGGPLATGSTAFVTPIINTTTQYYAESRNTTTGCTSATRTAVTAIVNANPINPSATGAARCGTGSLTISATPGAGETIDWYAASSGGSALVSGSSVFSTGPINVTTTYYAEARNTTTGCVSISRTPVTATVNLIPAAPSGTGDIACGPNSLTLTASPSPGETTDWYAASSGGTALLSGSNSFTTGLISSTTIYYAQARNTTTGCTSATRTAVTATINSATNSTTNIPICETALPYTWNNTIFNTGGTFTVTLVNAAGCDSLAKLLLDVAAAIHVQNVTGGGSYTTGGAGVPVGLSGSEAGVNYQLLLDGTPVGSAVAGTNAALNFGNQLQAGTYTVFATTSLCSQAMAGSATVTVMSGPPTAFAVTGGGTYCAGGTGVELGLAGSQTGVSYQLKRSNGTINVGPAVAGTGSALSFGFQTTASIYSVLATNTVSLATQVMLNNVEVRIAAIRAPSAPGIITGTADACPYLGVSNVIYTIRQAANATSYLWTAPAGAVIIGSNTDTMVVIQYPTSFVSGTLSVVAVNTCFSNATSSARNLTITKKVPSTPGTITPSLANPCPIIGTGSTATYTIRQVTYATGYTWTLPAGITYISNLGDTGIVVRFETGFSTGVVSVVAYNNCATSSARSLTVTAKVPSTPTVINGIANVCIHVGQATTATFSISPVSGAGSYLWTAPANSAIVSGQGTVSVEVSFAAGFSSGSLTVKSVAACGSSSARSLSLTKLVARPGAISASAPACPSTNVTYTIAAVPFATSYLWSLPTNAIYLSGQGTTSYTVSYKPTFVSGTVTVKSVNNCSTSSSSSLAVTASGCTPFARSSATAAPAVAAGEELNIYPNPTNGIFRISSNAACKGGNLTIQLIDVFGKIVMEQKEVVTKQGNVSAIINASNLIAGIYEVRCFDGDCIRTKKLMLVK
ncbi:MAG: M36 family metallopeptidase [Ferruginibacter sp.]